MDRSVVAEVANMSESYVRLEGIANMSFSKDPMLLTRASAVAQVSHDIPVLTNHKPIKMGADLVVETPFTPKAAKGAKRYSWHQVVSK